MAKICLTLTSNRLPQRHFHCLSRPTPFLIFFSRHKLLSCISRFTPHFSSGACRASSNLLSISLRRRFMEKSGKASALSSHESKTSWDSEEHGGGDSGADGNGSGRSGDGGNDSGDGDSFGHSKGDDTHLNSLFSWYFLLLDKRPVTTKAITSALLSLLGDLVCQLLIEKSGTIDLKRMGVFALLGLVLVGPTLHFWYLNLSKLIPGPGPFKAGSRLVLDQFLFSPVFIAVFISAMLTLEGHAHDIAPKLKQDLPSVVLANWKIWIPFQFLNFLFMPQQLQVLAANVISLVWNTYLSFASHKDVMSPAQKDSFASS